MSRPSLPSHVASICDLAMTKPLKGGALEDLLEVLGERRQAQADSDGAPSQDLDYRGLTTKSLMRKCYSVLQPVRVEGPSQIRPNKKEEEDTVSAVVPRHEEVDLPRAAFGSKIEPC